MSKPDQETPDKPQTLDEFVTDMAVSLGRFKANWDEGHAKHPDRWPMQMPAGDWYDQFLMFLSQ